MPRCPKRCINACIPSGLLTWKSQNMFGSGTFVRGWRLWLRFMLGNLIGSRMKKTGRSLKTKSWLPSSVKSFIAHPRTSRTVSLDPFSPATVEIRHNTFVLFPIPVKNLASVRSLASCVTSNSPQAPAAFAWTLLQKVREGQGRAIGGELTGTKHDLVHEETERHGRNGVVP